jgi:hypothetical protein
MLLCAGQRRAASDGRRPRPVQRLGPRPEPTGTVLYRLSRDCPVCQKSHTDTHSHRVSRLPPGVFLPCVSRGCRLPPVPFNRGAQRSHPTLRKPSSSPTSECQSQRGGVEGVYCRAAVELYSYTVLYRCCIEAAVAEVLVPLLFDHSLHETPGGISEDGTTANRHLDWERVGRPAPQP